MYQHIYRFRFLEWDLLRSSNELYDFLRADLGINRTLSCHNNGRRRFQILGQADGFELSGKLLRRVVIATLSGRLLRKVKHRWTLAPTCCAMCTSLYLRCDEIGFQGKGFQSREFQCLISIAELLVMNLGPY